MGNKITSDTEDLDDNNGTSEQLTGVTVPRRLINRSSQQITDKTVNQNKASLRIVDNDGTRQQFNDKKVNQNKASLRKVDNDGTHQQFNDKKVNQNKASLKIVDNDGTCQQFNDKKVNQNEASLKIVDNDGTCQQFNDKKVNQNEASLKIVDNNGTCQQFNDKKVNQNEASLKIVDNDGACQQFNDKKVNQNEASLRKVDNDGTSEQFTEVTVNQKVSSNVSDTLNNHQHKEEKVEKKTALTDDLCLEKNSTNKEFKDELHADNIIDQNKGFLSEPDSEISENLNSVLCTNMKGKHEAFGSIPSLENKVIKEETENCLCDIRIENNLTTKRMTCQPCIDEGDQIVAVGFCKDCKNYLCALCLKMHLRPKPMRSHRIISFKEMPERQLDEVILSERMIEEETCPEHKDKIIEYYCEDEKVLGCSVCMTLKHGLCKITYLPNNYTELFDMANSKQLNEDIFTLKDGLETGKLEIQCFKKQVEAIAEKAIRDVTAFRNKLVLKVDNIQKAMINEVKQMKQKDNKSLDKVLLDIRDLELTLKQIEEVLKRKEQTGCPGTQMYLCVRKSSDEVKEYQGVFGNIMEKKPRITSYQFQPTNAFLKSKTKQFCCLKTFNDKSKVKTDKPVAKTASTNKKLEPVRVADAAQAKAPDKLKDVKLAASSREATRDKNTSVTEVQPSVSVFGQSINEINVKTSSDKQTCVITGMTMIHNQKIALCDYANCCVKIIDINNNYKLTFWSKLSSPPYEAAFTGKHLVVTQPWKGTLAILTNTDQFKPTLSLSIGAECRGIAYWDEKFFVSFKTNPAVIKVLRETGEVLRTFRSVGGDPFNHPCHLALHPTRETLYVSDWQIAILGFDGSVVRKHRDLGFIDLKGVSVSIDGNLYVCDKGRNVVYVLLPMVSAKRVFLDESRGIKKPFAVLATGCTKKTLYVSLDESNVIKVFQIS